MNIIECSFDYKIFEIEIIRNFDENENWEENCMSMFLPDSVIRRLNFPNYWNFFQFFKGIHSLYVPKYTKPSYTILGASAFPIDVLNLRK